MPYGYDKTRSERRCEKCQKLLYVFEVGKLCIECSRMEANKEQYSRIEKIIISKIDNPDNPEYRETTQTELEQALKGKFVSCNVQYRDEKTDALVCNVFVQKPPDGF